MYEIPVGPVHAGLIEPGHFRFSVAGETVLRLKARLWFVHRGLEKLFQGRPADGAVELGRTRQRRHLRRARARPQPRRRRRARGRTARRGAPAAGAARRAGTALQPCHRPGRAGQRRRVRTGQRTRSTHPRSNCCGSTPRSPGIGCCAAPSARARSRCVRCPTPTQLRVHCGRRRRGRRTDPAQRRGVRPVRRNRRPAPGRRSPLSAAWATSRAPAACAPTPGSNIPPPRYRSPRSAPPPVTCWPAIPCAATNSPLPPELACHLIESHTGPTAYAETLPSQHGCPQRRRHRRRLARHHRAPRRNRRRQSHHPRQDRRPVLVQLARAARRDGRHDRSGLPAGQQKLQPVLRRQRSLTFARRPSANRPSAV